MKITVNPGMEYLRQFVRQLPELFPASGEVLHDGRNQIRAFDIGGERLVVKRYKRPSAFNAVMYSFFRKSKARRAYEHALRLRELEIDTPEPVAWSEYRRNGLITETYFVSRRSDYTPLTAATERFPTSDSLPVLEAFSRFTVRLHEKGIMINEELTKNEINQLITQRLNSQLESAEFKKKVKDIIPAVLEELFKVLWQKRSFWQSSIKR